MNRRDRGQSLADVERLEPRWAMATSLSLAGPAGVVYEGSRAEFTLTLSEPTRAAERVFITTAPGTATFGTDYFAPASTQILFAPGQTRATFALSILSEAVNRIEGIETFRVIATPANRALGTRSVSVSIDDTLPPPLISVSDVTVTEGNSGTTPATFQITLSARNNRPVTVVYVTRDGTATAADGDYAPVSGVLTFAPGEVSKTVSVNVNGDRKAERDETFSLVLTPPAYGTIKRGTGTATIRNDETDQQGFQITVNYVGNVRQSIRDACDWAARRWAQVIVGDLPSVFDPAIGLIDDFRIDVQEGLLGGSQNGPGGTLANAGPVRYRTDATGLPWLGIAGIDPFDASDPQLRNIVLHEFGHALGFGGMWLGKDLVQGIGTTNPIYVGPNAVREYSRLFNVQATSIPVENLTQGLPGTPGDGSYGVHWRESLMTNELMTSLSELPGVPMPLSTITVGAMADLGYEVSMAAADLYQPAPTIPPVTVPSWSVQDFRIVEGNNAVNVGIFYVRLTFPQNYQYSGPIEAAVSLQDGTATGGDTPPSDYLRPQSVRIRYTSNGPAPQQAVFPVLLTIFGDNAPEPDETFFVRLTDPTNGSTILTSQAAVTIINDDSPGAVAVEKVGRLVPTARPNSLRAALAAFSSLSAAASPVTSPGPAIQPTVKSVSIAQARSCGGPSTRTLPTASQPVGVALTAALNAGQPRTAAEPAKTPVSLIGLHSVKPMALSSAAFASLALR